MMYITIALMTGSLVIISMIMNSRVGDEIGLFQGVFINYVLGTVVSILILLFNIKTITIASNIPWWAYLGGVLGVVIVSISNVIIPKIPTIYTTLLIFIGQLFTGMMIDLLTHVDVSKGKVIGGLLICIGLFYNLIVDKKQLGNSI
ncbi:MAG TPA: DMT family transporter [Epulopiscium sp.]|nr:DMT family transporter [Candidatus Epulonipiscium sp.]